MGDIIFTNRGLTSLVVSLMVNKTNLSREFIYLREYKHWVSMDGNMRLIKDLSNNHLDNIIIFINGRFSRFDVSTLELFDVSMLKLMKNEKIYRTINNINVPEYEE